MRGVTWPVSHVTARPCAFGHFTSGLLKLNWQKTQGYDPLSDDLEYIKISSFLFSSVLIIRKSQW